MAENRSAHALDLRRRTGREAGPSIFVILHLEEFEKHLTSPCMGLCEGDGTGAEGSPARPSASCVPGPADGSPPCSTPAAAGDGSPRPTLISEVHAPEEMCRGRPARRDACPPVLVADFGLYSARSPGRPRSSPEPHGCLSACQPTSRAAATLRVAGARNVRRWVLWGPDAWTWPGVYTARLLAVMVPAPTDETREPASPARTVADFRAYKIMPIKLSASEPDQKPV